MQNQLVEAWIPQLDDLRSSIVREKPTFHVFEYRSERLLYDINAGALISLTNAAFLLLKGFEEQQPSDEIALRLRSCASQDEFVTLVGELRQLLEAGFFVLEPPVSMEQRKASLESLHGHKTRSQQILVQTSCNLKCTYCYEVQNRFHGSGKSMSVETGKRAVDELLRRSGERTDLDINFFGGEPLLNFALVKTLVEYAEQRAVELGKTMSFRMTTNGVLLTSEIIEFLVAKRFGVMLSIDGDAAANDIHRRDHAGKGVGEQVIQNAKRLVAAQRAAGVRPATIRATLTPQNPSGDAAAEYFRKEGFPRVMIGASTGRADHKDWWDLSATEREASERALEGRIDRFLGSLDGLEKPLPNGTQFGESLARVATVLDNPRHQVGIHCGVGRNMTAITDKGDLYPCHRYVGDAAYRIGSLASGIDYDRLNSYYEQILDVYDKHCSGCWARYLCGGQCPWYISRADGAVGVPDKEGCDGIRAGSEKMLWLHSQMKMREQLNSSTQAVMEPSNER